MAKRTAADRFWAKVDRSGGPDACWPWIGGKSGGYGRFWNGERHDGAHRFSWELANGTIPDGMNVLHDCPGGDDPSCVNPAHLWVGTIADNSADMVAKDRHVIARGEAHVMAKLTDAKVLEIRRRWAAGGVTQRELADEYGASCSLIGRVVNRKVWTHLPPEEPKRWV